MRGKAELRTTKEYYSEAFKTLKGSVAIGLIGVHFIVSIGTFVVGVLYGGLITIALAVAILWVMYGIVRYALSLARDKERAEFEEIFVWGNEEGIGRVVSLCLILGVIYAIAEVGGVAVAVMISEFTTRAIEDIAINIAVVTIYYITNIVTDMAMYNLAGDKKTSAVEAIKRGINMILNYKKNVILLMLVPSVVRILILPLPGFIFYIAMPIISTYMIVAGAHMYIDIVEAEKQIPADDRINIF